MSFVQTFRPLFAASAALLALSASPAHAQRDPVYAAARAAG